ncbi:MAG: hypothetical protein Q4F78_01765 [Bacillota bacterium]|nr:hypothetical protein [Bacillota bacterium]
MLKNHSSLLLCSLTGNLILCGIGILVAPIFYRFIRVHADIRAVLFLLMLILIMAAAFIFFSLMGHIAGKYTIRGDKETFVESLKSSSKFMLFFVSITVVYALLCGLMSSLIYFVLHSFVQYDVIKQIINILTHITTVAVIPVVIMELLSFSLSRLETKDAIRAGLAGSKEAYFKLLLIIVVFLIAGATLSLITGMIGNSLIKAITEVIGYTIIGGLGTYIVYRIGIKTYTTPRRRKYEREY